MKAIILPLDRKYYGTTIEVDLKKNYPENKVEFSVWYSGNYNPSDRELERHGITRKEWDVNKFETPREDGFGGMTDKPKDYYEICDSHFESQDCYELCKLICDMLNKHK